MSIKNNHPQRISIPEPLQQIPSSPKELFIIGSPLETLLERPRVAIIGSRKATPYGRAVTELFAEQLANNGVVIISGLALGIDALAHQATLNAGGTTVAVLPCGIEALYPRSHLQLAQQIIEHGGTLMSEYPGSTPPRKEHFIARNRLVAGLADAVLITEAAEKSGTLHTVNFALGQGKTVFAVPGNITSQISAGCNQLIKSGALAVTEVDDILHELGVTKSADEKLYTAHSREEQAIITLIKNGVSDGHQLLAESKLSPSSFNETLTMLEISGTIKPLGNNQWSLK